MNKQIKQCIANAVYAAYEAKRKLTGGDQHVHVLSIDETIRRIDEQQLSMIRFGDGDLTQIRGRDLPYQTWSQELADDIRNVLSARDEGVILTVPDIFDGVDQYVPESQEFWKDHLLFYRKLYYSCCHPDMEYGSTSVSRCYVTLKDRSKSGEWFAAIRNLWLDKKITIVEGAGSHTGVTNDLLDTATSVERIICPPVEAYSYRDEILNACRAINQERIILFALGSTSKIVGLQLLREGRRVLDIGNLDTEYEWYLAGVTHKVSNIKHTALTEEDNIRLGYTQYLSEIVQRIGC